MSIMNINRWAVFDMGRIRWAVFHEGRNQVGTLTQILVKRSFYLNPSILPDFGCWFDYLNLGNSQLITTIRVMWCFILSWPNIILTLHTVKVYSFPSNGITRIWVILGGTQLWQWFILVSHIEINFRQIEFVHKIFAQLKTVSLTSAGS